MGSFDACANKFILRNHLFFKVTPPGDGDTTTAVAAGQTLARALAKTSPGLSGSLASAISSKVSSGCDHDAFCRVFDSCFVADALVVVDEVGIGPGKVFRIAGFAANFSPK